jgi:hypothetical protein
LGGREMTHQEAEIKRLEDYIALFKGDTPPYLLGLLARRKDELITSPVESLRDIGEGG